MEKKEKSTHEKRGSNSFSNEHLLNYTDALIFAAY